MSSSELDRFQLDLRVNPSLAKRVRDRGFGLASITETAKTEGYDFELAELKTYISEQSAGVLSDEQLAAVAAAGSTWTVTSTAGVVFTAGPAVVAGVVAVVIGV